jgi:hypothetical protein
MAVIDAFCRSVGVRGGGSITQAFVGCAGGGCISPRILSLRHGAFLSLLERRFSQVAISWYKHRDVTFHKVEMFLEVDK